MAADHPNSVESVACTRCSHQPLQFVTSIPKRFDQPSGFAILKCEACGQLQWEPRPSPR